jgi:hypothetical protein
MYERIGIVCRHMYQVLNHLQPEPEDAVICWHKIYGYFYGRDEELTALFDISISNEPPGPKVDILVLNKMWPVGQGNCDASFFTKSLNHVVIHADNMWYLNSQAAVVENKVTAKSQGVLELFGLEQEIHISQAAQISMKDVPMQKEREDGFFFDAADDFVGEDFQNGYEHGPPNGNESITIQVSPLSDEMHEIYQQHVFKGGNGSFRALKPTLEILANLVDSPESYHLCKELLNGMHQELLSRQASKKKSSKSNPGQNTEYETLPQLARNKIYRRAGIGNSPPKKKKEEKF